MQCPEMGRWQGHFKPPPKPYGDPRSLSRSQKEAGGPQVTAPGAAIQEVLKEGSGGAGDTRGGSAGSSFLLSGVSLLLPRTPHKLPFTPQHTARLLQNMGLKLKIFLLIGFHFKAWTVLYSRAQIFLSNLILANAMP